jgi:hypothetical protein
MLLSDFLLCLGKTKASFAHGASLLGCRVSCLDRRGQDGRVEPRDRATDRVSDPLVPAVPQIVVQRNHVLCHVLLSASGKPQVW